MRALLRVSALIVAMASSLPATAQVAPSAEPKQKLAERYFTLTHHGDVVRRTYEKQLRLAWSFCKDAKCQSDLERAIGEILPEMIGKYEEQLSKLYAERMSEDDLQAAIAFADSRQGQALIRTQESITDEMGALGHNLMMASYLGISAKFCPEHPDICRQPSTSANIGGDAQSPGTSPSPAAISVDGRTIVYDGETVRLTRAYATFEDYKDDPNNIDPSENAHVERLMTRSKLPVTFASREAAFRAVSDLVFPGYGWWGLETPPSEAGSEFSVLACEIPRAGKSRYVTLAQVGNSYRVVDDFVAPDAARLRYARREGGKLVYTDVNGRTVATHDLR